MRRFTIEEYLLLERRAETKSDYLDGEIFAMSGASRPHNLICTNRRVLGTVDSTEPSSD